MKKHHLRGRPFTTATQIHFISAEVIVLPLKLPTGAANLLPFLGKIETFPPFMGHLTDT